MKTVSEQMELARKAQAIVNDYTQEQIDEICLAIGWEVYEDENIAKLAKMAVEETGYGNVQSKIIKHKRKVGGVLHDIKGAKSVGLIERNEETGISKYAKPVGVVCAILPATNPTATCGRQGRRHPQRPQRRHLQAQFPRAEKHHRGHQHDARRPAQGRSPRRPHSGA